MACWWTARAICLLLTICGGTALAKVDEGLVLYRTGSLREAMSHVALLFTQTDMPVRTEFGAWFRPVGC